MKYSKITLVGHGIKGAVVEWYDANNKGLLEPAKKTFRNPVHIGLQKQFKELRVHLLSICGIINSEVDNNTAAQHLVETTVHSIELDGDTVIIKGEKLATADKSITLKTYRLEESDGYEHFEVVKDLIDSICLETTDYMTGSKKADDVEAAMQWVQLKGSVNIKEDGKTKTLSVDDLKQFSPEKLKDWATKFLESSCGSVVMHNEDMDISGVDVTGPIQELATTFEVGEETVIDIPVVEEKPKKEKKKNQIVEGSFSKECSDTSVETTTEDQEF